ncbi:tRNA pseudouridine(38/39) synthase-like isoform X1 [Sinocyclocheilus rhinocerous]|uniref:tRNA pseudouridine(38/39) synthase-like isoform X1 n=2 Tax=Sinocyclocheilus rhinocerous TaxID=307959 RepID=UPI0007B8C45B|nr:PREDICTED: tRNA pseudouridine(38/39) synthase-like isoform X1 [Sinocyclocheilus rhinocerous]
MQLREGSMSEVLLARVKALEEEGERLKAQLKVERDGAKREERTETSASLQTESLKHQEGEENRSKQKKRGAERPFDFSVHPRRHVALRLAYLGWQYQGFAVQENTDNTVEARLFEALLKTKLIQDRQTSTYHRCGRTDKGVSAFSQVISIDVRSTQYGGGLGVTVPAGVEVKGKASAEELPYVKMLNRVLPQDIRILQWAPVETGFSARFDCQSRTYRYYFPRGDLDVDLMAEAAKRYEGTHDFRNICKMDVGNGVLRFQRTILSASIQPAQLNPTCPNDPHQLYVFQVKGLAFLYHQVRCMMALLLLIGQKLEAPEIIDQLLDVEKNPRKPQYSMAVDYPLVLYDCHFEGVNWRNETEEENHVLNSLHQHWVQNAVKTQVLLGMIQGLQKTTTEMTSLQCWLMEGSRQRKYQPLLDRPRCESLESRIQHFVKRGRLEQEEGEDGEETTVFRGKRSKHSHLTTTNQIQEQNHGAKTQDCPLQNL